MKIAIPVFGNRVSPRFDCANSFVMAIVEGHEITVREQLDAAQWSSRERIARLLALGLEVVVCGGIDCWSAESLRRAGIALYSGVAGASQESLNALINGELDREKMMPPAP